MPVSSNRRAMRLNSSRVTVHQSRLDEELRSLTVPKVVVLTSGVKRRLSRLRQCVWGWQQALRLPQYLGRAEGYCDRVLPNTRKAFELYLKNFGEEGA